MTLADDLNQAVINLAVARKALADAKGKVTDTSEILHARPEYEDHLKALEVKDYWSTQERQWTEHVRNLALTREAVMTSDDHPGHPAVQIIQKTETKLRWADGPSLRYWCMQNLPLALVVDRKVLMKVGQALGGIEGVVEVEKVPSTRIKSDLSPYLPPDDD